MNIPETLEKSYFPLSLWRTIFSVLTKYTNNDFIAKTKLMSASKCNIDIKKLRRAVIWQNGEKGEYYHITRGMCELTPKCKGKEDRWETSWCYLCHFSCNIVLFSTYLQFFFVLL